MAGAWRQKHHQKNWTKSLDISFLYQLQTIAEQMRKRAAESDDKELLEWAGHIRLIVARANGEEVNISLSQHQMPEDAEVKIPDPRG
jgi:hypothetical protein